MGRWPSGVNNAAIALDRSLSLRYHQIIFSVFVREPLGMSTAELITVVAVVAAYFILMRYILPRFGVST